MKIIQPKADQPRVMQKDLTKDQPNLQYRVQAAKNYGDRTQVRTNTRMQRGS